MALLTIAIPTYNRASFLDRCLKYLFDQLSELPLSDLLELIVSDNCSTDNTREVVESYKTKGLTMVYVRNEQNMGPDFNINQCYKMATGKYVVAFGDDDVWLQGSLKFIFHILQEGEWGVVHLRGLPINSGDPIPPVSISGGGFATFKSPEEFVKKIHVYSTFISGNIINRSFVDIIPFEDYSNTYLSQVPLILGAVYGGYDNVYVETPIIAAQVENSGGYNFFKVFGANFYAILVDLKKEHPTFPLTRVANEILIGYFPIWIVRYRKKTLPAFKNESPYVVLKNTFGQYFYFWTVTWPLFHLPKWSVRGFNFSVRNFKRFRDFVNGAPGRE